MNILEPHNYGDLAQEVGEVEIVAPYQIAFNGPPWCNLYYQLLSALPLGAGH